MLALHGNPKPLRRLQPHTMVHGLVPLIPLSLDRVLGGDPLVSTFPIFQLPVELLTHIVLHLSPADITNLALVDRDANQLARTLQFVNVELNYRDHALDLLDRLKEEVYSPQRPRRCIGACIRRLKVSSSRDSFNAREGVNLEELRTLSTHDRIRCVRAAKQTEAGYLRGICDLLPHLPNLHTLEWDEGTLTSDMMRSMMSSSLICLKLDGPILHAPLVHPPPLDDVNWALETLFLNVTWSPTTSEHGSAALFVSWLLQLTAPTLRQLICLGYADRLSPPCRIEGGFHFPVLRDIALDQVNFGDSNFLQKVLDKCTTIQSLSVDSSPVISRFLAQRGHIPSLVSFRWDGHNPDSYDDMIRFVHENPQLSCFEATSPLPSALINSTLKHRNSPHFEYLVVLHLVSEGQDFSDEDLKTIALIDSLQHLWLSAGAQYGVRHQWAVNHPFMTDTLRFLTQLRTLVFTRDSYQVEGHPLLDTSIERYYMNKVLPHDLFLNDYLSDDELTKADYSTSFDHAVRLQNSLRYLAWERWHQSQMVMLATEYSKVFRDLQWCFIGQLLMRIEDNPFWRIAELDVQERDPALKSLYTHWAHVTKGQ